jgi:signal transduction histidine kinase
MKPKIRIPVFAAFEVRIVAYYLIAGGLWILFSDRFVRSIIYDTDTLTRMQTYKGWFFVGMSGVLIYFITQRYTRQLFRQMQELKDARAKAEESDRLKTAFLQNISHEIRTPLNSIIGFSDLLAVSGKLPPAYNDYLERIISNSDDLIRFIKKIIDVSMIEAGQVKPLPRDFVLKRLTDELREEAGRLSGLFPENRFICNEPPDVARINLYQDYNLLKSILFNLLENAFKFTQKGDVFFSVAKEKSGSIVFKVEDTGMGIEDDKKILIFERFRQSDESIQKTTRGAGLGLYIVKMFSESVGANLAFSSEYGKGTTFRLTLKDTQT